MRTGVKILAKIWLLFFLITIVVIGFSFAVTLFFPIMGLAKFFPKLKPVPDQILYVGIYFLMWVQPWFNAQVEIDLPQNHSNGLLLVSNHRSHLDVFVLLSRIRGIRILARSNLFKIPFLGLMMRSTRQIGVERGRFDAWIKAMDTVKARLHAGERVHVFPEMTRCAPGFRGVQPFTSGPFLAALQEDAMVLPMVFKNTDGVWPKGFVGLNFRQPVEVRTLTLIRARDFGSADALRAEVVRQIEAAAP